MDPMVLMDNLWILIAFILVILMQGGFILLEAGSTRMKNAGHIAGKTIFTLGIASLGFAAIALTVAFGGFAERAKLSAYIVFAVLFSAFVYPIIAHWVWGAGWIGELGKLNTNNKVI